MRNKLYIKLKKLY